MHTRPCLAIVLATLVIACTDDSSERLSQYATFRLTADLSTLTDNERQMIPILIEAADAMDEIFWQQAWGDPD
ncbi:MAG: Zn-dependent hydrolase, partial [Gemmatimonadetes bacterium]|nr:Zn-dependent hydrolase [Gemmatimonadota bacterium]